MTTTDVSSPQKPRSTGLLTAEEWLKLPDDPIDSIVFGSPDEAIIESGTKNIVEGTPKAFKTTFLMSLLMPASKGQSAYSAMPLFESKSRRILYFHGEMNRRQIRKRTESAAFGLERPLNDFWQVRDLDAHLINPSGQAVIIQYVQEAEPTDVVFDPWQSFIKGHDENSFVEMSKATGFIDRLIEAQPGLTVWIPQHIGKDVTKGGRGHSSIDGWRDARIKLSRRSSLLTVAVEPRWSSPLEAFTLRFEEGRMVDADGTRWTPKTELLHKAVQESGGTIDRTVLGAKLGMESDALRKAIHRAKTEGAVDYSPTTVTVRREDALADVLGTGK